MSFAIIQRSPGGGSGYTISIGRRTTIWTGGGPTGVAAALVEERGAVGSEAVSLSVAVFSALADSDGKFALVNLPEKRRARKAVRP